MTREEKMSKKRGVLVWGLFVLATILLFVSSLTVWSKRQLLDDQAWADSSTQLLANDEVRAAIAQELSDALFQRVDVEAQLRERLPAQRQGTAAALAAALQNTVVPAAADRLLQRPRVQTLWENLNKRAHAGVVKVLEGEDLGRNGNISTANGAVTLDLRPAITRLATRLGLEDKLKANADPDAGQLVIMKSDQLGAAQTAVKILKALSSLLVIAVFAFYALAIYFARGRRRLLLGATGASLVFVGLVIASLRRFAGRRGRRLARQDGGEQASGERDLGDRDERAARHRGHPRRLRCARPPRNGLRRPKPTCSRRQALAGTHLQTSSDRRLGDRCRRVPAPARMGTGGRQPGSAGRRAPRRHDRYCHRGAAPANAAGVPGGSPPGGREGPWSDLGQCDSPLGSRSVPAQRGSRLGDYRSGFRVYRIRWTLFLGIGLTAIPLGALAAIAQQLLFGVTGLSSLTDVAVEDLVIGAVAALLFGAFTTLIAATLVNAACAEALDRIDEGEQPDVLDAYRGILPALPPLAWAMIRMLVVAGLLVITVIGIPVAVVYLIRKALTLQSIVIEERREHRWFERSGQLVRGDELRVLAIGALVNGTVAVLGPIIGVAMMFVTPASLG